MDISNFQALSEIILPPGSTSADLQAAIDNAASGDMIVISGDMHFKDVATIPAGKEITIRSDTGNNWVMSQPNTNIRHFTVTGILILQDITLDGMHSSDVNGGGGVSVNNGSLTINDGVVIQNCYFSTGGGVLINNSSKFIMTGGLIKGSIAGSYGGGGVVANNSSTFTMSGGTISGNSANQTGGGVRLSSSSTFTMSGGTIDGNKVNNGGGGVFITGASTFTMSGGAISGNISNGAGGGISVSDGSLEITGESYIINNNSANNSGGGIYTSDPSYGNLRTSSSTVFNCNRASIAKKPPENAGTLYPNIRFASTTITNHPLNNYDIFYWPGEVIDATFRITYDANGGTGNYIGPGIKPCDTDTVLPIYVIAINRSGFTFIGWNTEPDGSGISFAPDDVITITSDMTLYAQWKPVPKPKRLCCTPVTKCRISIEGQKIWVDDDNKGDTRPDNLEILLLRDGEVYDRRIVNSANDWAFGFCCVPIGKKSGHKYDYRIDEVVPNGYTKTIEGYNVINTLNP